MENEEITNSNLMRTDFARKERMAFLAAVPRENLPSATTPRRASSGKNVLPDLQKTSSLGENGRSQSDQRQPPWVQVWHFLKWAFWR